MTYIGEDAVALLADAALETEGQVVAADHNTTAVTLLKWLHIWLDAGEVQPLDNGQERRRGGEKARRKKGEKD